MRRPVAVSGQWWSDPDRCNRDHRRCVRRMVDLSDIADSGQSTHVRARGCAFRLAAEGDGKRQFRRGTGKWSARENASERRDHKARSIAALTWDRSGYSVAGPQEVLYVRRIRNYKLDFGKVTRSWFRISILAHGFRPPHVEQVDHFIPGWSSGRRCVGTLPGSGALKVKRWLGCRVRLLMSRASGERRCPEAVVSNPRDATNPPKPAPRSLPPDDARRRTLVRLAPRSRESTPVHDAPPPKPVVRSPPPEPAPQVRRRALAAGRSSGRVSSSPI